MRQLRHTLNERGFTEAAKHAGMICRKNPTVMKAWYTFVSSRSDTPGDRPCRVKAQPCHSCSRGSGVYRVRRNLMQCEKCTDRAMYRLRK